ncbi:hypothetical protein [Breoghania sp. L-A4]|uniref:hypothetical protein n=1 Tax=Breoghania sp. L-A4 TaxID=2304600 RepID=UPI000E360233|nr:hypothetical protein [Breoghania sp. L-A4]AXS40966.1 hypothetical protein D1F64_14190 [Breoghania sp. L-A4]
MAITVIVAIVTFILSLGFVLLRAFISGDALSRTSSVTAASVGRVRASAPMAQPEVPVLPVSTLMMSPAALWRDLLASDVPARCIAVVTMDDDTVAQDVALALLRTAVHGDICPILIDTLAHHSIVGDDPEIKGLSELLSGEASFSQVIQRDPASRAHVIEAGRIGLSEDLVSQSAFDTIMEALNHTYDHVVVDLGKLDGSAVSERFLEHADHVVIASGGSSDGPSIDRARSMLARHDLKGVSVLGREKSADAAAHAMSDMAA